jgi:hypothetical protein
MSKVVVVRDVAEARALAKAVPDWVERDRAAWRALGQAYTELRTGVHIDRCTRIRQRPRYARCPGVLVGVYVDAGVFGPPVMTTSVDHYRTPPLSLEGWLTAWLREAGVLAEPVPDAGGTS